MKTFASAVAEWRRDHVKVCALHNANSECADRVRLFVSAFHALQFFFSSAIVEPVCKYTYAFVVHVKRQENRNFLIDYPAHKQNRVMQSTLFQSNAESEKEKVKRNERCVNMHGSIHISKRSHELFS